MLKSRWRIILKKIEQKTTTLKKTVIAACVLHNICIERGDLHDADDSMAFRCGQNYTDSKNMLKT